MPANTRAIITAAGQSRRWGNHLEVPKHLAPVQGPEGPETLLRRLVRQLRAQGVEDIVIVSPVDDTRYETEGARLFPRQIDPRWGEADRYMSTPLWNTEGRTLYIPGDLYASDDAMSIMVAEPNRTWVWYLRLKRYAWKGVKRSRAVFGLGFWPEHHDFFRMSVKYIATAQRSKRSPIKRSLGVDIYRAMAGETEKQIATTRGNKNFREYPPHSVIINDITTDIDDVKQYRQLLANIAE